MFKASILNWVELKPNETSIVNNLTRFSGMLQKMSTSCWDENSRISKIYRPKKMPMANHESLKSTSASHSSGDSVWGGGIICTPVT